MAQDKKITQLPSAGVLRSTDIMTVVRTTDPVNQQNKQAFISDIRIDASQVSDVVTTNTNQTITGVKTFDNFPIGPITAPTEDGEFVNKKFVDDNNYFTKTSGDIKAKTDTNNINLQQGGLKDEYATTVIKLADTTNTSFNTNNKTIVGAVNEKANAVNGEPQGFQDAENEITLSFDDNTRTLTITKTGVSYTFFSNGKKFIKTTNENIIINDTQGNHFIYYDENGTLQKTMI
jgi:hypothetical protein